MTTSPDDITDERYLTRREAEILIANAAARQDDRAAAHAREHKQETEAIDKALVAKSEQQQQHNEAHDKAHDSHEEKHRAENEAIGTALAALDRERKIHAEAHDREHLGHQREHGLNNLAIDKAEAATDKRFTAVNGTRDQMSDLIRSLASKDTVDGLANDHSRRWEELRKELDRRFEEQRAAISALQLGDSKQEGRGLGQAATIALIVTAVGFVGTVLGIVIVISNVATTA